MRLAIHSHYTISSAIREMALAKKSGKGVLQEETPSRSVENDAHDLGWRTSRMESTMPREVRLEEVDTRSIEEGEALHQLGNPR